MDEMAVFVKERQIACDALTQDQLAVCFSQALACGDFQKHVAIGIRLTEGQAQQVTYIPFREVERLNGELKQAKELLKSAFHALRSYENGNDSPVLAAAVADKIAEANQKPL